MRLKTFLLLVIMAGTFYTLSALDTLNQRLLYFATITPPTEDMTLQSLSQTLRAEANDDMEAAELAFYWIVEQITYDFDNEQISKEAADLEQVLRSRRGNVQTLSQLYQEICTRMGIQCHLIPGYVNFSNGRDLGEYSYDGKIREIPDKPFHSWNLVKINGTYYGVDVSLGSGSVGGTMEEAVWVKKYDLDQVLVASGVFFKIHLSADPRWQFREHPISLKTFNTRIPFSAMLEAHQSSDPFNYQAAIAEYENAAPANRRLMTLKSTLQFNRSDFNMRQYADALYNMGYTQSLGDYETQRLLNARKFYEQAIDAYQRIEQTAEVQQLVAQAHQGITYVAYRLDKKQ